VGAENVVRLRRLLVGVLVDEAAEPLPATNDKVADGRRHGASLDWWCLLERAVRPVAVVVLDVDGEDMVQLALVDNQDPVEQFAA
jgi:hypothetical protein